MQTRSAEEITTALAPIAGALQHDGYVLEVTDASEHLSLRITANEDACEDCLVPQGVMAATISSALDGAYAPNQIEIAYPGNAH
jgi:hypothetical protein